MAVLSNLIAVVVCLAFSFSRVRSAGCDQWFQDQQQCVDNGCIWNPTDDEICDMEADRTCCGDPAAETTTSTQPADETTTASATTTTEQGEQTTTTEEATTTTEAATTTTEEATTTDLETTPSPTSCFNAIHDWIIDDLGQSTQFRFRSQCSTNQFLKIKMVSLIEYDSKQKATKNRVNSFAPHDWYWISDEDAEYEGFDAAIKKYVSSFGVAGNEVEFNLTTVLFYEEGELASNASFGENTLKWTTEISNWPFLDDDNTLKLCINVMTNAGSGGKNNSDDTNDDEEEDEEDEDVTRFTFNDFEFRLEDTATCGDDEVDVEVESVQKNQNHLNICFTFKACDDVINHDPFVEYVPANGGGGGGAESQADVDVVGISLGASFGALAAFVVVVGACYFYKRNGKLRKHTMLIAEEMDGYDTMQTQA